MRGLSLQLLSEFKTRGKQGSFSFNSFDQNRQVRLCATDMQLTTSFIIVLIISSLVFAGGQVSPESSDDLLLNLDRNITCIRYLETVPPYFQSLFTKRIPTRWNLCRRSCPLSSRAPHDEALGHLTCTSNWKDITDYYPFLLFRCGCSKGCPSPFIYYGRYKGVHLGIFCNRVDSNNSRPSSRCQCDDRSQQAYKCMLDLWLFPYNNPYYCVCCRP